MKLVPQDAELYVFAENPDRVAKERRMRRRRMKWLWDRLKKLATMKLTRDALLMKLGARAEQDACGLATGQHRDRRRRRLLRLLAQSQEATRGAPARRTSPTAYQPDRVGSLEALGVLPAVGFCRGGLQTLKGDLAIRPTYHQLVPRIEAHIFVSFLAHCLHVTPSTPKALIALLPPRPLRLLPAGATISGWVYLPLRERTFSRRTKNTR